MGTKSHFSINSAWANESRVKHVGPVRRCHYHNSLALRVWRKQFEIKVKYNELKRKEVGFLLKRISKMSFHGNMCSTGNWKNNSNSQSDMIMRVIQTKLSRYYHKSYHFIPSMDINDMLNILVPPLSINDIAYLTIL